MERSIDLSALQQQGGGEMPIAPLVVAAVISILMLAACWKLYTKAGKPGWAALIPIYNFVVLLQIVRKPMWWIVMFFIPFVNFIFCILLYVELAKAFGKSTGFAVGLILLGIIFLPILAFGSARYVFADAPAQQ